MLMKLTNCCCPTFYYAWKTKEENRIITKKIKKVRNKAEETRAEK